MYTKDTMQEKCSVELGIPADWKICCSMPQEDHVLRALDYHELVDSPFIASPSMQHDFYVVNDIKFHLWFQGEFKPDWDRLKTDFTKFTEKQLEHFKAFPTDEYHFIFQITPYTTYHGVEHKASTVIALGPTYDVMEELYTELLGVSSHELYHAWNIKSIRPKEMYPYDFSKENYSRLGFVCEGVTTYLGDQFLLKSGVFDLDQYLIE
jgi:predicted metalloprotease with PDZ domain